MLVPEAYVQNLWMLVTTTEKLNRLFEIVPKMLNGSENSYRCREQYPTRLYKRKSQVNVVFFY